MICSQIDWEVVVMCLKNHNPLEISDDILIKREQEKMIKRINLMFDLNLEELKTNYWLFKSLTVNSTVDKQLIHISFIPMDLIFNYQDNLFKTEAQIQNKEWHYLQELANKFSNDENYIKLKIVTNRLLEITKENYS